MARPVKKSPPMSLRLSLAAHEELVRRATKAGKTPREHLEAQLEKSLGGKFEMNEVSARMEPPPKFHVDPKPADFLGVAGPQNVPCRHWRKTALENGRSCCLQCGEVL